MSTDITRNSFDPAKAFTRVVRQQGRMDLDADFNEQSDILLHLHRSLARDLFGAYVVIDDAFQINKIPGTPDDLTITPGVCYIDGIRIEVPPTTAPLLYSNQPYPDTGRAANWADEAYVAFLDVWERDVTAVDDPALLEPALQGADTSARTQLLWQIKLRIVPKDFEQFAASTHDQNGQAGQVWQEIIRNELAPGAVVWNLPHARMAASALDESTALNAKAVQPTQPQYNRDSNQLYRIQIHTGGDQSTATFKWSRDNSCIAFRGSPTDQKQQLKLDLTYAEGRRAFKVGDTAQINGSLNPGELSVPLYNVSQISADGATITLDKDVPTTSDPYLIVVKWDSGAVPVSASQWQLIEQGIQIRFESGCCFRAGEYWLIPARADTSDIIWPKQDGRPACVPSTGGHHHYAPLAIITRRAGAFETIKPTRRTLSRKAFVLTE